jgi:hypothetical protein
MRFGLNPGSVYFVFFNLARCFRSDSRKRSRTVCACSALPVRVSYSLSSSKLVSVSGTVIRRFFFSASGFGGLPIFVFFTIPKF